MRDPRDSARPLLLLALLSAQVPLSCSTLYDFDGFRFGAQGDGGDVAGGAPDAASRDPVDVEWRGDLENFDAPTPADAPVVDGVTATPGDLPDANDSTSVLACPSGMQACDGAPDSGIAALCVSIETSAANCGACGHRCEAAHGLPACVEGICQLLRCDAGFSDCDGNPANGCEASMASPEHCGACSNVCPSRPNTVATCGASGTAGVCSSPCSTGFADCDGNSANGCELDVRSDLDHCGGCPNVARSHCTFAHLCVAGACVFDPSFQSFGHCQRESDYVRLADSPVVTFGADESVVEFTPRCLRVRAGVTVTFMGGFARHSFMAAPGYGTLPSPVRWVPPSTGTLSATVTFDATGYYPFMCGRHATSQGEGEAGVVWVE